MLGQRITDPLGVESALPMLSGMGLLPVDTAFEATKATYQAEACIQGGPGGRAALQGQSIRGYEIHRGRTVSPQPWLTIPQRNGLATALAEGVVTAGGRIWGCYVHGLCENTALRRAWLMSLGWQSAARTPSVPLDVMCDRLAAHVQAHLDMARVEALIGLGR